MNTRDILAVADRALIQLSRDGEGLKLRAVIPEDYPIPSALIEVCRAHKPELLAYLEFAERADALLLESTRRLAGAWPFGCDLDKDERWGQAEAALHDAYWSLDIDEVTEAVRTHERLALDIFASFRKEGAS